MGVFLLSCEKSQAINMKLWSLLILVTLPFLSERLENCLAQPSIKSITMEWSLDSNEDAMKEARKTRAEGGATTTQAPRRSARLAVKEKKSLKEDDMFPPDLKNIRIQ